MTLGIREVNWMAEHWRREKIDTCQLDTPPEECRVMEETSHIYVFTESLGIL